MTKRFLLDTNVILHDPKSLEVFADNEVIIPIPVLDELDQIKVRPDEKGRNARSVIRRLDELRALGSLNAGVRLPSGSLVRVELNHRAALPQPLADSVDNRLIRTAMGLMQERPDMPVIVVTKDINLRVKCDALGIVAQDYEKDKLAKAPSALYTGFQTIQVPSAVIDALYAQRTADIELPDAHMNEFVLLQSIDREKHSGIGRVVGPNRLVLVSPPKEAWGIEPRNLEQKLALSLLMDPDVKLVTLVGRAGSGKAQPLDAEILTPKGFQQFGTLKIGDEIVVPDGHIAKVSGIFPQGTKKVYRVCFSDGTSTECCMDHLWHTKTQKDRDQGRPGSVKSLTEICGALRYGKFQKRNHSIPIVEPFEFAESFLPIDPYVLGLLLGDGSFRGHTPVFSSVSDELIAALRHSGYTLRKKAGDNCDYYMTFNRTGRNTHIKNLLTESLVRLGLWGKESSDKFIPWVYRFASVETRLAVLRGLMDTDGEACGDQSGSAVFSTSSSQLCDDVRFLVESLGGTVRMSPRIPTYTYKGKRYKGKKAFRLHLATNANPFKFSTKADCWIPRTKYKPTRYVDKVEFVGEKQTQCILVDHPDHLYITNNFIVTHNTLLATAAALHQTVERKLFQRALLSRPVQPLGRDIGFLPGTVEEKLAPWMAALNDSLELLFAKEMDMLEVYKRQGIIQVEPLTYIRGRSIPNSFMIVDECLPYDQHVVTEKGKLRIGALYDRWAAGQDLPKVLAFNENLGNFEWREISHAWCRGTRELVGFRCANRQIKCTPEHKFLTSQGWQPASSLKIGDVLLTSIDENHPHQMLRLLNSDQEQVVLGSFLGDGSLANHGRKRFRLRVTHGLDQKDYCAWKASLLGAELRPIAKNGFAQKPACRFWTHMFAWEGEQFPLGEKHYCPQWVLDKLDARGLAIWFMDDGTGYKNNGLLHTCDFDKVSQQRFVEKLASMGIESKMVRRGAYPSIYITSVGVKKLYEIIAPFCHDAMKRKLSGFEGEVGSYKWNGCFRNVGATIVDSAVHDAGVAEVYDLEVADAHTFVLCSSSRGKHKSYSGVITHNCQNLTTHEIKTIVTRIGEGSKIVLCGDIEQIDNPFVDFASNGLTNAIERLKDYAITGHVTLHKCERSELAELAAEAL